MTAPHIAIGKQGEDAAADYLIKHGYVILARNVRTAGGEIDLIARDTHQDIVFVEVKANKKQEAAFPPSIRVNVAKIARLRKAAELWLEAECSRGADLGGRIDVIEVCEGKVTEHFEDVTG